MKALKPKIAIIGAGNVGSTFAFSLMISGLAREIVLVDKDELLAKGECMDLNHGNCPVCNMKLMPVNDKNQETKDQHTLHQEEHHDGQKH